MNLTKEQTQELLSHEFGKCNRCEDNEQGKKLCLKCFGTGTELFKITDEGEECDVCGGSGGVIYDTDENGNDLSDSCGNCYKGKIYTILGDAKEGEGFQLEISWAYDYKTKSRYCKECLLENCNCRKFHIIKLTEQNGIKTAWINKNG